MFIINPLSGHGVDNLFTTHPATENRIAALQQLAAQMGAQGGTLSVNARGNVPAAALGAAARPRADRGDELGEGDLHDPPSPSFRGVGNTNRNRFHRGAWRHRDSGFSLREPRNDGADCA